MTDSSLKERFAQNVVLLKYVGINPVIIHGGGPQIDKMLDRLGMEAKFRHGVRMTDEATMEIVEMVLAGRINMEIIDLINRHGGSAVGLSGKDGGLIFSKPLTAKAWAESLDRDLEGEDGDGDFGLVGDIENGRSRVCCVICRKTTTSRSSRRSERIAKGIRTTSMPILLPEPLQRR